MTVDSSLLSDFSAFVEKRLGLHFPEGRTRELERGIRFAARELGYEDAGSCVRWLLSSPISMSQIETLASHLTIGETYFFRDKGSFDALSEHVLPNLIRVRKGKEQRLRIWSAGCSSGEEAYSIAMSLDRIVPDPEDWHITILATDINLQRLERAAKGVYRDWSFRGTPDWVKERYFVKTTDGFQISPNIKRMVTFCYHNLMDDPYPTLIGNTGALDIIFCRNVLMYFSRERAKEAIGRLNRCLVNDGWFIVSPVEASHVIGGELKGVKFPAATLYRKVAAGSEPEKSGSGEPAPGIDLKKRQTAQPPLRSDPAGTSKVALPEIDDRDPSPAPPLPTAPVRKEASPPPSVPAAHDVASLASQAKAVADEGRLSEALEMCERALRADKLSASLQYLKATILTEIGSISEAAASLKRAIYIDQGFVLAHFALGHLMHRQERYREAERYFENARSLLKSCGHEDILPESEGLSAVRLLEIIEKMERIDGELNS